MVGDGAGGRALGTGGSYCLFIINIISIKYKLGRECQNIEAPRGLRGSGV